MKRNLFIIAYLVFFSIFFIAGQAFGSRVLDDFSGTYIDGQRWNDLEEVREISNGKLHLNIRGSGEQVTTRIDPVDKTDYLQAKILIENESYMDQTGGHTRLIFIPYNESRGPGSGEDYDGLLGHTWVTNRIWMDENRNLKATAGVFRFDDPDANTGTYLLDQDFSTTINFDTEYILSIEYTGSTLIFKCNEETINYTVPTTVYPSFYDTRSIRSRVYSGGSGYIKTKIDDVYIVKGGPLYDDFETALIDASKWEHLTLFREISGGKLRMNVQADGERRGTKLKSSDQTTNYFEAKVVFESGSWMFSGATGRARIGGNYYNDSRGPGSGQEYNGFEGDVYVINRIVLNENDNLKASALVWRHDDADWVGSGTTLFYHEFTTPISYHTEYTLSIELRGKTFIFKCIDETYTYDVTTPMYEAYNEYRWLEARIWADPGESGYMKTTFDDVCLKKAFNIAPASLLLLNN